MILKSKTQYGEYLRQDERWLTLRLLAFVIPWGWTGGLPRLQAYLYRIFDLQNRVVYDGNRYTYRLYSTYQMLLWIDAFGVAYHHRREKLRRILTV